MTITISRAALHDLLTDAHVALAENRPAWTGAVLHVLRRATAPEAATPQGLARRLVEQPATGPAPSLAAEEAQPAHHHHLQDGPGEELPPADAPPSAEAPPIPAPALEPAQAAGGFIPAKRGRQGEHPPTVWTPERRALLAERYPHEGCGGTLMADLNALPGPALTGIQAVHAAAMRLGVRITSEVARRIAAESAAKARAAKLARIAEAPEVPRVSKWTRARLHMLADEYPTCTDRAALFARINELPGEPLGNVELMRQKAKELGIRATDETLRMLRAMGGRKGGAMKRPDATAEPPPPLPAYQPAVAPAEPTPEEQAASADAAVTSKHHRAKAALADALRKHRGSPPIEATSAIAARHSLPLREVMRLLGEVRREEAA